MMLKLVSLVIITVTCLTGCAIFVKGGAQWTSIAAPHGDRPPPNLDDVECQMYMLPQLPPIPDIPMMDDEKGVSRDKYENHLLNIIALNRRALIDTRRALQTSYQTYLEKCHMGKTTQ